MCVRVRLQEQAVGLHVQSAPCIPRHLLLPAVPALLLLLQQLSSLPSVSLPVLILLLVLPLLLQLQLLSTDLPAAATTSAISDVLHAE